MKKRVKKIRGTRTCGGGSHKKRRGKGSKGGVGNAGAYDVHVVRSLKMGIVKGKRGSTRSVRSTREEAVLNIGELDERLDEWLAQGKAEQKGESVYLDAHALGIEKLLGKGTVTRKLIIKATKISRAAREKIEELGGVVEVGST